MRRDRDDHVSDASKEEKGTGSSGLIVRQRKRLVNHSRFHSRVPSSIPLVSAQLRQLTTLGNDERVRRTLEKGFGVMLINGK